MIFSQKAGINVGLVTIVWRLSAFMTAFADYMIFG
jgi:hypothetical protein